MKKLFKITLLVLLLLVVASILLVFLFDANKYRQELAGLAQTYTGRPVALNGDVQLSVYPWIGIQLHDVTIGNETGPGKGTFSRETFASIQQFGISLKLLPLLQNRLEIEKLVLKGLDVNFEINASGEKNWSGLNAGNKPSGKMSSFDGLQISGIDVTSSRLSWHDVRSGKRLTFSGMNLETQAFVSGQALPLVLTVDIESNQPAWKASASVDTQLVFNPDSPVFSANALKLKAVAEHADKNMQAVDFSLTADTRINIKNMAASVSGASVNLFGLAITGNFEVEELFDIPTIQGPVHIKPFQASTLAKSFNIELPELSHADSLKDISLNANFKTDFDSLIFEEIVANIDRSQLKGGLRVTELNSGKAVIRYELSADSIDWNDYTWQGNNADSELTLLPLGFIRGVDLQGTFDVDSLKLGDLPVSAFHLPLKIKNSILMANPVSMSVNDARVRGAIELRAGTVPMARAAIKVSGIQAQDSLNPVFEQVMGSQPIRFNGTVDATANVKSKGESLDALQASLEGSFKLTMAELDLSGVDLRYATKKVVADYAVKNSFRTSRSYLPAYDPEAISHFKAFKATFKILGNRISSADVSLDSNEFKITGSGSLDFDKKQLDYRSVVDVQVTERIDIRDKLLDHPMEYDVKGEFGQITTEFDFDKYDLLAGRLLHIEAKARRIRAINERRNNSW